MTSVYSIHTTNDISMNDDEFLSKNIMHHFSHQRRMKMYLLVHNMIQRNEELVVINKLSWIYY